MSYIFVRSKTFQTTPYVFFKEYEAAASFEIVWTCILFKKTIYV